VDTQIGSYMSHSLQTAITSHQSSDDLTIRVWDVATGEVVAGPFMGHTESVFSVAFLPDGKWIASTSSDRSIRVWDAATGEVVAGPFTEHTSSVLTVAFSPDGHRTAEASSDRTIRV
jgi:WD40 repeat protein